jgi:hypothetical protein
MIYRKGALKYFLLLTACLLFNSCNDLIYSPEKENYVNVPIPQTKMTIDLSNAGDTTYVFGKIDFHFTTDTKGKIFSHIVVYIDSTIDGYSYDMSLYTLNSAPYSFGPHKLRMDVWAKSGSGSLADHAGAEYIVCSSHWDLFIDNRVFNDKVLIDSCFCENGSLSITWKKYPFYNFVSYTILWAYSDTNGNASYFDLLATVKDRNTLSIKDTTYAGGPRQYKLVINAYNGSSVTSFTSPAKYFNDRVSDISCIVQVDKNTTKIVCSRIKYYNNISKVTLKRIYTSYESIVVADHSPDDTVFFDTPGFGYNVTYTLNYSGPYHAIGSSAPKSFFMGNSFPAFNDLIYNQNLNSYYVLSGYNGALKTDRLDPVTLNKLASCSGTVIPSNSGSIAYGNGFGLSTDPYPHSFTKVNPLTLQPEGSAVYTDKYVGYYSTNTTFTPLESGLLFYVGYRFKDPTLYGYGANILFDPGLPAMIGKDSTSDSYDMGLIQISAKTPEGEYIIPPGSHGLYAVQIRTLYKMGTLTSGPYIFSQTGKEYICTGNSAISFYKCSNMSLIKSFPLTDAALLYPNIDPSTGYLGGYYNGKYKIYDLNNGNLINEIQLPSDPYLVGKYYLYNSTLFCNYGFSMNLAATYKKSRK